MQNQKADTNILVKQTSERRLDYMAFEQRGILFVHEDAVHPRQAGLYTLYLAYYYHNEDSVQFHVRLIPYSYEPAGCMGQWRFVFGNKIYDGAQKGFEDGVDALTWIRRQITHLTKVAHTYVDFRELLMGGEDLSEGIVAKFERVVKILTRAWLANEPAQQRAQIAKALETLDVDVSMLVTQQRLVDVGQLAASPAPTLDEAVGVGQDG